MASVSESFQYKTTTSSNGTRNGRKVPLEICGPKNGRTSGSVLYMPGFAEVHWHSEQTRKLLAEKGVASVCPQLRPGDKPEVVFTELLENPHFQLPDNEGKRSVITHSNGIRAFAGEMTTDRLDHLQATSDDITVCNGPLHKEPTLPVLFSRYMRSYVQAIMERRFSEIAHDIPTASSWIFDKDFFRELRQTGEDLAGIEPNIRAVAERFGAALNFVVDPNDSLCPPDDLVAWHREYTATLPDDPAAHPKIYMDTNGHSPSYREPGKFALLIRKIARLARGIRREAGQKMRNPIGE